MLAYVFFIFIKIVQQKKTNKSLAKNDNQNAMNRCFPQISIHRLPHAKMIPASACQNIKGTC